MNTMNNRYRLIRRSHRQGMFYCVDKTTGKRTSLLTTRPGHPRRASRQEEKQQSHDRQRDGDDPSPPAGQVDGAVEQAVGVQAVARGLGGEGPVQCQFRNLTECPGTGRPEPVFPFDQFLNRSVERIHCGIRMPPGIAQRTGIERARQGAVPL